MILRVEPVFTFTLIWLLLFGDAAAVDHAVHKAPPAQEQRA